jgi:hypothetical protein
MSEQVTPFFLSNVPFFLSKVPFFLSNVPRFPAHPRTIAALRVTSSKPPLHKIKPVCGHLEFWPPFYPGWNLSVQLHLFENPKRCDSGGDGEVRTWGEC